MPVSRYQNVPQVAAGRRYGTSTAQYRIRNAVINNRISYEEHVLKEGERLDIIAGRRYGNSLLFWVIAAASGIGWCMQVPPGTRIIIPSDLSQIDRYV